MICLIETFLDQINNLLTLLFGENGFGETGIEQASNSHWMMRLLVGREITTKINVIGIELSEILVLRIGIAR